MNFFKSSRQYLGKVNDLEVIPKQYAPLLPR